MIVQRTRIRSCAAIVRRILAGEPGSVGKRALPIALFRRQEGHVLIRFERPILGRSARRELVGLQNDDQHARRQRQQRPQQ